jgi:hypothetical protein
LGPIFHVAPIHGPMWDGMTGIAVNSASVPPAALVQVMIAAKALAVTRNEGQAALALLDAAAKLQQQVHQGPAVTDLRRLDVLA